MATADSRDRALRLTELQASSSPEAFDGTTPAAEPLLTVGRFLTSVRGQLVRLSFWSAVFLPVLYVPLFLSGAGTPQELVLWLIGAHVVALIGGRTYHTTLPP